MLSYIIIFILILSFSVLIHEFGHFITAKKSGMKVEEFGIGYPPRLFGKKIGETVYSVNAIPFGGFVKIYGEDNYEHLNDPLNFNAQPIGKRAFVLVAGVFMNFITAVIIFYFLVASLHFQTYQNLIFNYKFPFGEQRNFPLITYVLPDSPASNAGLRVHDLILEINGKKVNDSQLFISLAKEAEERKEVINLTVENQLDNKIRNVSVVPKILPASHKEAIGISLANVSRLRYSGFLRKISVGFLHSFNIIAYSLAGLVYIVKVSFVSHSSTLISHSIVGPVGILALTKIVVSMGTRAIFNLIALISLALAITNILPLPALDGGKLSFLFYEYVFRRRPSPNIQRQVETVGFFLLVSLAVLITFKDFFQFKSVLFH